MVLLVQGDRKSKHSARIGRRSPEHRIIESLNVEAGHKTHIHHQTPKQIRPPHRPFNQLQHN